MTTSSLGSFPKPRSKATSILWYLLFISLPFDISSLYYTMNVKQKTSCKGKEKTHHSYLKSPNKAKEKAKKFPVILLLNS